MPQKKTCLVGGLNSLEEREGRDLVQPVACLGFYLATGVQRIWSSFNTQLESPTLNEAVCLPFSRAITMLLSAAWAVTETNKAAIARLLISWVVVICRVSVMRFVLIAMYGWRPIGLIERFPTTVCEIHVPGTHHVNPSSLAKRGRLRGTL